MLLCYTSVCLSIVMPLLLESRIAVLKHSGLWDYAANLWSVSMSESDILADILSAFIAGSLYKNGLLTETCFSLTNLILYQLWQSARQGCPYTGSCSLSGPGPPYTHSVCLSNSTSAHSAFFRADTALKLSVAVGLAVRNNSAQGVLVLVWLKLVRWLYWLLVSPIRVQCGLVAGELCISTHVCINTTEWENVKQLVVTLKLCPSIRKLHKIINFHQNQRIKLIVFVQ